MTALRLANGSLSLVEAWTPERNQTHRLSPGRHGVRVRVEQGLLLVTQAGDHADHLLGPGQELRLAGSGLGVAWALEPSSVTIFRDRTAGQPPRDTSGPVARAG